MPKDPSALGTVEDVTGATVSVVIDSDIGSGLVFVEGHSYRVGQVGSFVRVRMGLTDLIGVVSRAGVGAVPERLAADVPQGKRWLTVELVGSGTGELGFQRGVSVLPAIGDQVHVVTRKDLARVYGSDSSKDRLEIGRIASADAIPALLDINALIGRHCAVVGTTGAGKSTAVATLLRQLTDPDRFPSARVLLYDIHGEYGTALEDRGTMFQLEADGTAVPLYVPYWALSFDELTTLTFGDFNNESDRGYVRDVIVRMKRENAASMSLTLKESEVTADTPVPFSIHEVWMELHHLVNATHTQQATGQSEATVAYEEDGAGNPAEPGDAWEVTPPRYRPQSQAADAPKVWLSGSLLNIRRQVDSLAARLRDRRMDFLFRPGPWAVRPGQIPDQDLDQWLAGWLGGNQPITILDLSGVPADVLVDLVGVLTRVLYDALFWARQLAEGGRERPLLMVFEEAHTYLGAKPTKLQAAKAVQRVVKEGRKYGVSALVVSQRPSEVDSTILSQCGTIVALRLSNAKDREHVSSAVSENLAGVIAMLPLLRTGEAIIVGEAVPLVMRAMIDMPTHLPESSDPEVVPGKDRPGGWDAASGYADYLDVVETWRSANPRSRSALDMNKGDGMDRQPVISSNLAEVGYDDESHTLEILFRQGGIYQYFDVPRGVYEALMGASSKGEYFVAHVRGGYRYARL